MNDLPKLAKWGWEALAEIALYADNYYWRPASMRKLEAHGFVILCSMSDARPAWRITHAGRDALAEYRSRDSA